MKRYICSLIGCRLNDWLHCKRCDMHLYDGGYVKKRKDQAKKEN